MYSVIYILPEIFLSLMIMFLLMVGVFMKKSFKIINLLTIFSLIFATALVLNQPKEIIKIFSDSYIIDKLSIFMKVLTLLFCMFVLLLSKDYVKRNTNCKLKSLTTGWSTAFYSLLDKSTVSLQLFYSFLTSTAFLSEY